jgi:hypothetical protein
MSKTIRITSQKNDLEREINIVGTPPEHFTEYPHIFHFLLPSFTRGGSWDIIISGIRKPSYSCWWKWKTKYVARETFNVYE